MTNNQAGDRAAIRAMQHAWREAYRSDTGRVIILRAILHLLAPYGVLCRPDVPAPPGGFDSRIQTGLIGGGCKLIPSIEFEERYSPSRPFRLGTRRRKPRPAVSVVPEAGASCSPERRAPSLDTEKQLATTDLTSRVEDHLKTVFEWSREQRTERGTVAGTAFAS